MSNKYWISGVQLGMLIGLDDDYEREKLIDEIIDKQFLGSTKEVINSQEKEKKLSEKGVLKALPSVKTLLPTSLDTHSQIKKEIDNDYASDKLNETGDKNE